LRRNSRGSTLLRVGRLRRSVAWRLANLAPGVEVGRSWASTVEAQTRSYGAVEEASVDGGIVAGRRMVLLTCGPHMSGPRQHIVNMPRMQFD
jgi:hypothetical protein